MLILILCTVVLMIFGWRIATVSISKLPYPALLIVTMAGCAKNEQAIEQPSFTNVELKAITVDSLLLKVEADEILLTNSMYTPGNKTVPVKYFTPTHRFRVTDMYSNSPVLDTPIAYKPGINNSITFFQPAAGAKLVWIGPPVNEPLPPNGKIKISVVYTLANLPDRLKLVVRNSKSDALNNDFVAVDSFSLKKGDFSKYFTGGINKKAYIDVFTDDGLRQPVTTVDPAEFTQANPDYSIYSFGKATAGSATMTKLY
jgi:hypothetical protein